LSLSLAGSAKFFLDERSSLLPARTVFDPIFVSLLQARKSDDDVNQICEMCDKLKVSQIVKILNLYTPADEYEERVTPAFVRKIQAKLSHRALIESQEQVSFKIKLSCSVLLKIRRKM
jgi:myosin-5